MKTFKSEHRELLDWLTKEVEKTKEIPWEGALDGAQVVASKAVFDEYRRRFRELKQRYSK